MMQIDFRLKEKVNGVEYSVDIFSTDGETFRILENGKYTREYASRDSFLDDFPELEAWFFERTE